MDKLPISSAIEKIKQNEQNNEAILKAKREIESNIAAHERSLRQAVLQLKKYKLEEQELVKKTDDLSVQVTIHKIRRDALAAQLTASTKKLEELTAKLDEKYSEIRELRSTYCTAVQSVSDECDIWALLMKPVSTEPLPRSVLKTSENSEQVKQYECRLKRALERRDKAKAERDRLMVEPDTGEEFVRIKNAIRYSREMAANFRK